MGRMSKRAKRFRRSQASSPKFTEHKVLITPKSKFWKTVLEYNPEFYESLWDLIPPTLEATVRKYEVLEFDYFPYQHTINPETLWNSSRENRFLAKYKDKVIYLNSYEIEYVFRIGDWWKDNKVPNAIRLMKLDKEPPKMEIFYNRITDRYGDLAEYDENYRKRTL